MNQAPHVKLSDVCALVTDGTHYTPPDNGKGSPFLTVKNMTANGLDFSDCIHLGEVEFARAAANNSVPQAGDVLFSKDGTVGKVHVVSKDDGKFSVLSSIAILRPKLDLVLSEYLGAALTHPGVLLQAVERKTGSAIRRIILKDLKEVRFRLAPLLEQRRIVDILNCANSIRRLRHEALAKARRLVPTIFVEMFGAPGAQSPFPLRKLGDVLVVKSGDFLPASKMDPKGHYPVYGGNGINGHHSEFMFEQPVVVIGRVGAHCGNVHLADPHSWVTDNALYVAECRALFDQEYLVAALKRARLNQYASQSGQPLISFSRIKAVDLPVPPIETQRTFAARVADVQSIVAEQERAAAAADQLVASLMAQCFAV